MSKGRISQFSSDICYSRRNDCICVYLRWFRCIRELSWENIGFSGKSDPWSMTHPIVAVSGIDVSYVEMVVSYAKKVPDLFKMLFFLLGMVGVKTCCVSSVT